jgi:hypothetical protein
VQRRVRLEGTQRGSSYAQIGSELVGAAVRVGDDPEVSERDCGRWLAVNVPNQRWALKQVSGIQFGEPAEAGVVRFGPEVDVVCVCSPHGTCSACLRGRAGGQRPDVLGVQWLAADTQSPLRTSSTTTQVTPRMFSPSIETIASVSRSTI